MDILTIISDAMIPCVMIGIIGYGISKRKNVYEDFVDGARDGLKTVVGILPTLIGLMVAVGVLSRSGFLDFLGSCLKYILPKVFPTELVPVTIVKMFSSSAATGLVIDIFRKYGADSQIGFMTAIMMSSTETIFYTMSVYYLTAGVKKTRWTLAGAMIATLAGTAASVIITIIIF
ncbi:MAG: spore maturation protein [Eubacterium sp.]